MHVTARRAQRANYDGDGDIRGGKWVVGRACSGHAGRDDSARAGDIVARRHRAG